MLRNLLNPPHMSVRLALDYAIMNFEKVVSAVISQSSFFSNRKVNFFPRPTFTTFGYEPYISQFEEPI